MKLGTLAGPLGSYTNYINYIALSNFIDYEFLKQGNVENNRRSISDKFKEIRFFLNTAESFKADSSNNCNLITPQVTPLAAL
jgi:hypothetical protein